MDAREGNYNTSGKGLPSSLRTPPPHLRFHTPTEGSPSHRLITPPGQAAWRCARKVPLSSLEAPFWGVLYPRCENECVEWRNLPSANPPPCLRFLGCTNHPSTHSSPIHTASVYCVPRGGWCVCGVPVWLASSRLGASLGFVLPSLDGVAGGLLLREALLVATMPRR